MTTDEERQRAVMDVFKNYAKDLKKYNDEKILWLLVGENIQQDDSVIIAMFPAAKDKLLACRAIRLQRELQSCNRNKELLYVQKRWYQNATKEEITEETEREPCLVGADFNLMEEVHAGL